MNADAALQIAQKNENIKEWVQTVLNNLRIGTKQCSDRQLEKLIAILLIQKTEIDESYNDVFNGFTEIYMENEKRFW